MKKIIINLLLAFAVVSCTAELAVDPAGGKITQDACSVTLKLSVAREIGPNGDEIIYSRADIGSENENKITDIWVFQFGTDTPTASTPLVGTPQYAAIVSGEDPVLELSLAEDADHTLLVAANLGTGFVWDLPAAPTYADVIGRVHSVTGEASIASVAAGLTFSGRYVGRVSEAATIALPLARNAVKLELQITPDPDECEIISVQVCNVAASLAVFEGAVGATSGTATTIQTVAYDAVEYADGEEITGGKSFTFYVPANLQGTVTNAVESRKTELAPASATYFRIVAKDGSSDDYHYFLSVYPGADNVSDFNLAANTHYTYTLAVNTLANFAADPRIETDGPITQPTANSYIVNPTDESWPYARRSILIPVRRINDYWGGTLTTYGNTLANVIDTEDAWTAELLWQDKADIVGITATKITLGRNAAETSAGKSSGVGPDGGFVLNIPKGLTADSHGNFVVAVKKDGADDILWSWHFWVTDYNPDQPIAIDGNTFQYTVPGGEVHRYKGTAWGYTGDVYSPAESVTSPYARSVIMDRTYGVTELAVGTAYGRGKLYYQFGRKDPMPGLIDLYDIHGATLPTGVWDKWNGNTSASVNRVVSQATMAQAVKNPLSLYSGSNNWCSEDVRTPDGLWNDPAAPDGSVLTVKSIYDPCPPGWRMPAAGAFDHVSLSTVTFVDTPSRHALYNGYAKFFLTGYMRTESTASAVLNNSNERILTRVATAATPSNSFSLYLRRSDLAAPTELARALGHNIRCVSESMD